MKKQKGMVFFRMANADTPKDLVYYIHKDGSFMPINNVFETIDNGLTRGHIMKNAKHITSNYSNRVIASELLSKGVAKSVTWMSDNHFTEKKQLKYEFIHI